MFLSMCTVILNPSICEAGINSSAVSTLAKNLINMIYTVNSEILREFNLKNSI